MTKRLIAFTLGWIIFMWTGVALAAAPSVVGTVSVGKSDVAGATLTVSHQVLAGTDNRMLVVLGGSELHEISSVTYGGVTMSAISGASIVANEGGGKLVVGTFYLLAPAAGTANVVMTVSSSSNTTRALVALTLQDARQESPAHVATTAIIDPDPMAISSAVVTAEADTLLLDHVALNNNNPNPSPTSGAAEIADQSVAGAGMRHAAATRVQATPGAASAGWTWSPAQGRAAHGIIGVKPLAPPANPPQLTLNWVDNATNEDAYKVERRLQSEPIQDYAQIVILESNVVRYVDTPLTLGETYCYRVRASNTSGNSGYSNEACGVPGSLALPAAPSTLALSAP